MEPPAEPTETDLQDALDASAIRDKAAELNTLIRAANDRGLHVNIGISSWHRKDGGATFTTVAEDIYIERLVQWPLTQFVPKRL